MTEYRVYHFTIVEDPDYEVVTHYVEAFRRTADVVRFLGENRAEAHRVIARFLGLVEAEATDEGWVDARHAYDVE